ncbi:thioredoxin [Inconstantimicrobium mannanitabidum]|uniref:Thioredoxin n=1 Tax=Inconstantimicrobium mannanitabidum TaxID=1604901 RepID=A0ACB5RIJ3_9CLOT|nr:thioredoxin [Clostridium sp. TW13]GKX68888.1 thioredoxin [Clostridium sp. TW13]
MATIIESKDFKSQVLDANNLVVLDLFATWCGPCKMVAPIIDELSKEMTDVKFFKLDVDNNGDIAEKYQVASIPTLLFFKNGEVVDRLVGFRPKDGIKQVIDAHK